MFAVVYRWRIRPDKEQDFVRGWRLVSEAIKAEFGSHGSRLHKADDGTYVSYGRWPSEQARDPYRERLDFHAEGHRLMQSAIVEELPEIRMRIVGDALAEPAGGTAGSGSDQRGLTWLGVRGEAASELARLLGAVLGVDKPVETLEDGARLLRLPNGTSVETFPVDPDVRPAFTTGPVAGFQVDDFDAALDRLTASGAELIGPSGSLPDGNRWQVFRGPDGNVYALKHDPIVAARSAGRAPSVTDATTTEPPRAPYEPVEFYDDGEVFERYQEARRLPDDGNRTVEEPAIARFVGSVRGLAVLDLGCGDGRFGRQLLAAGAARYHGIDASERMLELARAQAPTAANARWEQADLESWQPTGETFDLVVSRMTVHYLKDLPRLLDATYASLRPGGRFVFSTEHPLVTAHYNGDFVDEVPDRWVVRDYFRQGERECPWLGVTVRKQHRTLADYVSALLDAGFALDGLSEGEPERASFVDERNYAHRRSVPMYVVFSARRS